MDQNSPNDRINDLLLTDEEPVVVGEQPARDEYDELLDEPGEFRDLVKEQIKQYAIRGAQADTASQEEQEPDEAAKVDTQIDSLLSENEAFLADTATTKTTEGYNAYEKRKIQISRLQQRAAKLARQEKLRSNPAQAGEAEAVVAKFIDTEGRRQAATIGANHIKGYEARIRQLVGQLRPDIAANPTLLADALRTTIEPMAFKEYVSKRNSRSDGARQGSYDSDGDKKEKSKDEYADAGPEEREFLVAMGLIEEKPESADGLTKVMDGEGKDLGYSFQVSDGRKGR